MPILRGLEDEKEKAKASEKEQPVMQKKNRRYGVRSFAVSPYLGFIWEYLGVCALMEDVPDDAVPKAAALIQGARRRWIVLLSGDGHEVHSASHSKQQLPDDELSESLPTACR